MRAPAIEGLFWWRKRRPARKNPNWDRLSSTADTALGKFVFNWPLRERLYRHLAVQVANEVTWLSALETFQARLRRKGDRLRARVIGEIARGIKDGRSLAAALAPWVPTDEAMMIASGEQSGNLPTVLDAVLNAKGKIGKVKRSVLAAVATPAVYMVALYGLIWAIGEFFIPSIEQSIPRGHVKGLGASLYVLGDAATSPYMIIPLALVAGCVLLVGWSLPRWTGPLRVLAERMFPFSFYRDINGYLWLLSFSALLSAGQPDVKILSAQARRGSPWLRERVISVRRRMENGASLPEALMKAGFHFPSPDMIDDIASTAGFRDFPARIAKIAEQWATELEWRTTARVKTLGFIFDLLIYGVMGYVLAAINSMSSQMGSSPIN